jgi:hypothetical protein
MFQADLWEYLDINTQNKDFKTSLREWTIWALTGIGLQVEGGDWFLRTMFGRQREDGENSVLKFIGFKL